MLADELQRHLNHHSQEEIERRLSKHDRTDQLVSHAGNEEGGKAIREKACRHPRSQRLGGLGVHLRLDVDVAQTPVVDGSVPLLPELGQRGGVPPVLVEQSVAEHGDLGEDVEEAVEDAEEEEEPDDEGGERAAEDAVDEVGGGVGEDRVHELHHDGVHQREGHAHVQARARHVGEADRLGTRVVQLVQQCGAHPTDHPRSGRTQEVAVVAEAVGDGLGGLLLHAVVGEDEGVALERHDHHQHHGQHGSERPTRQRAARRQRDDGTPDEDGVHHGEDHLEHGVDGEGNGVGEVQLHVQLPERVVLERVQQDGAAEQHGHEHALPAAHAGEHVEGDEPAALREVVDLGVSGRARHDDEHHHGGDHVDHREVVEALEGVLLDLVHQAALHEVVHVELRRTLLERVRVERRLRALHKLLLARAVHRRPRHCASLRPLIPTQSRLLRILGVLGVLRILGVLGVLRILGIAGLLVLLRALLRNKGALRIYALLLLQGHRGLLVRRHLQHLLYASPRTENGNATERIRFPR